MSEQELSEKITERFEILETKVLYQDRTIDDLNEVVTRQQDQIDLLTSEIKRLRAALETMQVAGIDSGDESPPPHY